MIENYKKFMLESNRIEREDRINPGDIEAIQFAVDPGIDTLDDILTIHKILGGYLNQSWVGKLRTCNVRVGPHIAPDYKDVPKLMEDFVADLPKLNSWKAHNEFEIVHIFQDLNGRVGRLIWLSKAVYEGYDFSIPFLQMYYYQTLTNYR